MNAEFEEFQKIARLSRKCRDGRECPPAEPARGRGDSACEQNGICQRVDLNDFKKTLDLDEEWKGKSV